MLPLKIMFLLSLAIAASMSAAQAVNSDRHQRDTANALEQQGNIDAAQAAWRAVLTSHPADPEAYAHLGLLAARKEDYIDAIPLYRKALVLNPAMPGLRMNLGLALFKSGKLEPAIQTFTPLLKTEPAASPDLLRISTLIGIAYYGLGQYSAAVPFLKTAAQGDPQNLQYRLLLAHSCMSSRQYECVLNVYHEILTLNAESAEADMLAGEAYDEMRNHVAAIEQFRAAVKADPKFPGVHFGLGYLLWTQNQFDEAALEFQSELANVPDSAQALAFLADSDMQLNHSENALPLIKRAIKIEPDLERAHLDLGILDANSGIRDDAAKELKIAARLSPEDPSPHWRLARLYQSMGKTQEAKVEFEKTSSLHKAENDTVFRKLKTAQDNTPPSSNDSGGNAPGSIN